MDSVDHAQKQTDLEKNIALSQRKPTLPDVGHCHYCTEAIENGKFCDAGCRDDFEQLNRG
jgi:hypothetical protein